MEILDFWNTALSALTPSLASEFGNPSIKMKDLGRGSSKGTIKFRFRGRSLSYNLLVLPQVTHIMLPLIDQIVKANRLTEDTGTFLLSKRIYPKIADHLINIGVNFMDALGNVWLDENEIYILQLGQKPEPVARPERKNRLFAESGLKLLFGALQNPELLNMTYREIANAVNISAASATILIRELLASRYLHQSNSKKILSHKKELLDRWVVAYRDQLQPRIRQGEYQSLSPHLIRNFRKFRPQEWNALWSGEAAANLYTNYLSPGEISLFVSGTDKKWMSALRLLPVEKNADLRVFRIFWNPEHPIFENVKKLPEAVPPLLVYAELITSEDSRNIETAQLIFDEYLQFTD